MQSHAQTHLYDVRTLIFHWCNAIPNPIPTLTLTLTQPFKGIHWGPHSDGLKLKLVLTHTHTLQSFTAKDIAEIAAKIKRLANLW